MLVVTGAAGFIGSCLTGFLCRNTTEPIVAVDAFNRADKEHNLAGKDVAIEVERELLFSWLEENKGRVKGIFHIGARTDTTEFDRSVFEHLNVNYSKNIWRFCAENNVPLIYASSAATYGLGEFGYGDDHEKIPQLRPLNPYGDSKLQFDIWALGQEQKPPHWYGLKFFNVYGPNEYHKGRMASVILHAFNQISEKGFVRLFRSHNPDYQDGEQLRDFVYVKDVLEVIWHLYTQRPESGIYNLGTGRARTFRALAEAVFSALGKEPDIEYIDTPEDIRDKYQYFTEADMQKLISTGYGKSFTSLEAGVSDYVRNYLVGKRYY